MPAVPGTPLVRPGIPAVMVNALRHQGRLMLTEFANLASPNLSTKGLITTTLLARPGLNVVQVSGFWSQVAPA